MLLTNRNGAQNEDVGDPSAVKLKSVTLWMLVIIWLCAVVAATANWTELRSVRQADAAAFDASFAAAAAADKRATRIINDLQLLSGEFIGAPTDLLQHSLQTAQAAYHAGEDEEFVVSALIHDIGELHVPVSHGEVAASYLRPHVRPQTTWVLEHHEIFQFAHYSHAWGVSDTTAPRRAYADSPYHTECIRFCEYDQASFNASASVSLKAARQLLRERYEPMLRKVLKRPSFWWDHGTDLSEHGLMVAGKAKLLSAYPDSPPGTETTLSELSVEEGEGGGPAALLPSASPPWSRAFAPKRFAHASLGEEGVMGELLKALLTDGACFVDGLPEAQMEDIWRLAKRVFAPRKVSHKSFWDARGLTSDAHLNNWTNTAETDTAAGFHASYSLRCLPPHTDGTYLPVPPRVKVLGTLAYEGEPCANTFVDGHAAATSALSRAEREALSSGQIMHVLKADPYSEPMSFNRSILDHDGDGRVHVAWNAHEPRSQCISKSVGGARAKMAEWINDPANAYQEVLRPGTIAIVDNWRVLHGREAVQGRWREMAGADVSDRALRARWRELAAKRTVWS